MAFAPKIITGLLFYFLIGMITINKNQGPSTPPSLTTISS